MSDAQIIAAVISALGAIGAGGWAALKWAVTQITKAINDSTAGQKDAAKEAATAHVKAAEIQLESSRVQAQALLEQSKAFATMSAKLDHTFDWIAEHTPVGEITPIEMRRQPMPLPLPDPPSERTPTKDRNPYAIPVHNDDTGRSQKYRFTRKSKRT